MVAERELAVEGRVILRVGLVVVLLLFVLRVKAVPGLMRAAGTEEEASSARAGLVVVLALRVL